MAFNPSQVNPLLSGQVGSVWGVNVYGQEPNTYPGDNVNEIMRLIKIAAEEKGLMYKTSRFHFIFGDDKMKIATKFFIKKAAAQVAKDFPNANGLALLEATNNLMEELDK